MGIASFVLGIVFFIFGLIPFIGYFSVVPAIVGLLLGLFALKKIENRELAMAGTIINTLTLGYFFIKIGIWGLIFGASLSV